MIQVTYRVALVCDRCGIKSGAIIFDTGGSAQYATGYLTAVATLRRDARHKGWTFGGSHKTDFCTNCSDPATN